MLAMQLSPFQFSESGNSLQIRLQKNDTELRPKVDVRRLKELDDQLSNTASMPVKILRHHYARKPKSLTDPQYRTTRN